jgi:hypothetical protein
MNEKPLERLNYYNGRPLDAADLKTEQEYHIRTRRWLNKSLYTAGIARGLEVREVPGQRHVIVSPGLALDSDGREIILLEETDVEVCSYAGDNESTVVGNYLVIEYSEETLEYEKGGCVMRTNGTGARKSTSRWGGPSRIEATPKFSWVPFVPQPGSNQIVLARVELTQPNCDSVYQIDAGARQYIGAASAAKVRQYALEGERHIDANNPGTIYFNIRGQQPNSVSLCLRSEKFSTLYYTEMGWHEHSKALSGDTETGPASAIDNHTHSPATPIMAHVSDKMDPPEASFGPLDWLATFATGGAYLLTKLDDLVKAIEGSRTYPPKGGLNPDGTHVDAAPWYALRVSTKTAVGNEDLQSLRDYVGLDVGKTGNPEDKPAQSDLHTHDLGISLTIDKAGVDQVRNEYRARNGITEEALTYVDDLQVLIGPDPDNLVNRTADIRRQIQSVRPTQEDWSKLGGGPTQPNHAFVKRGTGLIRLDFLPDVSFSEGEYVIRLLVASGGGRIHYNLYVE